MIPTKFHLNLNSAKSRKLNMSYLNEQQKLIERGLQWHEFSSHYYYGSRQMERPKFLLQRRAMFRNIQKLNEKN